MESEKVFIYGKHAVLAAIANSKRVIDSLYLLKENKGFNLDVKLLLNKNKVDINIKYINNTFIDNILKKRVKHQGIVVKSNKLKLNNYDQIFDKHKFKNGVILDSITDPNNVGAIYRSAKAFGIDFIINSKKNAIRENNVLLNSACGAFETVNTYLASNISNAIKSLTSEGWWIIGLDHKAKINVSDIISKMKQEDKFIFILGSEGKGIRRLIKENCNFLASIPNAPNTNSMNVSNAAAIVFYETYKMRNNINN